MSSPIYLRVKRNKTIWFVEATPQDTVGQLKQKLSTILNREKLPKDMRLQVKQPAAKPNTPPTWAPLEDTGILEQLGLENDGEVFLSFWIPGEPNPADGKWEPVEVPEFDPLNEDAEEATAATEEPNKGKGKSPAA
ncbi:hypothetical protein HDV00_002469 [Rhizophlyctis rosea]|nr:hypothetical protein HDV00_002469 [Rhizophlyctis rosea]